MCADDDEMCRPPGRSERRAPDHEPSRCGEGEDKSRSGDG